MSQPKYRATFEKVTPRGRRFAATRPARFAGSGVGSYPRKATIGRPELGRDGLSLALLPIGVGLGPDTHPGRCFPLEELQFPAPFLEVLAELLRVLE